MGRQVYVTCLCDFGLANERMQIRTYIIPFQSVPIPVNLHIVLFVLE